MNILSVEQTHLWFTKNGFEALRMSDCRPTVDKRSKTHFNGATQQKLGDLAREIASKYDRDSETVLWIKQFDWILYYPLWKKYENSGSVEQSAGHVFHKEPQALEAFIHYVLLGACEAVIASVGSPVIFISRDEWFGVLQDQIDTGAREAFTVTERQGTWHQRFDRAA